MTDKLQDLAEYLTAALPDAVIETEIRHGELCCRVERGAVIGVLVRASSERKTASG